MAEGTRLNTLQEQMQALQSQMETIKASDNVVPKWWEEQKRSIDAKMVENQSYISRILKLISQREEIQSQNESEGITHVHNIPSASMSQSKAEGKLPIEVTIIDEQGKLVTKHNEPGILSKGPFEGMSHISPTHTLPFKKTESIVRNSMMGSLNAFSPRPKIELPNFDKVNPRGWVKKCQKYFTIFAVNDHQKLEIAAMYLTSKAEVWFDGYIM